MRLMLASLGVGYAIGFGYTLVLGLKTFPPNQYGWRSLVGAIVLAVFFPVLWLCFLFDRIDDGGSDAD